MAKLLVEHLPARMDKDRSPWAFEIFDRTGAAITPTTAKITVVDATAPSTKIIDAQDMTIASNVVSYAPSLADVTITATTQFLIQLELTASGNSVSSPVYLEIREYGIIEARSTIQVSWNGFNVSWNGFNVYW